MPTLTQLHKKTFRQKFRKIINNLTKMLDDYIAEPTEENIHDIRITIRRLESAHRTLPKKIRKKQEIQNYVNGAKQLFKINTQIRDFDIICEKLERQGTQYMELVNDLKDKRKTDLGAAQGLALRLRNTSSSKLKGKEVSESTLNKRFSKIVNQLISQIKENAPIVISDEKKVEELHKLRKDFKKLRYLVELASDKTNPLKSIKNLKEIQDLLGEIHDCDIMLDYLGDIHGPNELSEVIKNEILVRQEMYQQFVQLAQDKRFDVEDLVL
jgi:CHAD domain-containing protein